MSDPQYEAVEAKILTAGITQVTSTMYSQMARSAVLACAACGPLPREDFTQMHVQAISHVQETGHNVAVETWSATVYGSGDDQG